MQLIPYKASGSSLHPYGYSQHTEVVFVKRPAFCHNTYMLLPMSAGTCSHTIAAWATLAFVSSAPQT